MNISNIEASRLVLEKMKAMSVDETLERMASCQDSDFSLAMEQLLSFSADSYLTYKQQHMNNLQFQEPESFQFQKPSMVFDAALMKNSVNEDFAA